MAISLDSTIKIDDKEYNITAHKVAKTLTINAGNSSTIFDGSTAETVTIPASMPADGGNADTLDSKYATDFVQSIKIGETEYKEVNNPVVKLPDYPTTLKNPNTLTIKGNDTTAATYDGSVATSINIKGSGATTVSVSDNGTIIINSTDTPETSLTIVNKSTTDTSDLVYAVTNLVEGGTANHTITPTYTGLPTKAYVDKMATGTVEYRGTISAIPDPSAEIGKGDFYRVSTAFTFGSETAHVGDILLATKDNPAKNTTDWDLIHTEVDSNTWVANTATAAGYVAAPGIANANKVWKTDSSGTPSWQEDGYTKSQVDSIINNLISHGTADPSANITSQYYFKY